ncbi:acyl-CoA dehydrogenase [Alsobacter soli]|uniref:Acyl-CoA dehydrogenase n=1 Tax=Alsobacter soli TaxID=2109933 RepID=A0A2T1HMU9_9HYPH|nr:acyl-CoA dehydrogenase [Alsobacter soli]PSC02911.1 acyl-CoA dehydrogenase [Alsobacter soli]
MDFSLTEEQALLRDSARRFVAEAAPVEQRLAAARQGDGFSRDHWSAFAELGWLGAALPEEAGGFGGGMLEAAIILEELGRGLVGAPLLSTAVVCAGLLARCEGYAERLATLELVVAGESLLALATEEPGSRYDLAHVETAARETAEGYRLSGRKIVVLDGASADAFMVSARLFGEARDRRGIGVFMVPFGTPGLTVRPYRTLDGRGAADLVLADVEIPSGAMVAGPDEGWDRLAEAADRAAMGAAADCLGAMEAAIEMTADYLKTRRQFGRPIGEFQTLAHRLADMFVAAENARSMLYRGLSFLDAPPAERARAVSASKVAITQAAAFVGQQAIQLHGGIGMSEEHPVGHFYKRLQVAGKSYGDLTFHMARYVDGDAAREQGA